MSAQPAAPPPETIVQATPGEQCGLPILVGQCPRCAVTFALTGQGKVFCSCGTLLRFVDKTQS